MCSHSTGIEPGLRPRASTGVRGAAEGWLLPKRSNGSTVRGSGRSRRTLPWRHWDHSFTLKRRSGSWPTSIGRISVNSLSAELAGRCLTCSGHGLLEIPRLDRQSRPILSPVSPGSIRPNGATGSLAPCAEVAAAIGLADANGLDPQQGFFRMGMDSLMAVELKNRLTAALGVALSSTVAFDHPNIRSLAGHLAACMFPADPPPADSGERPGRPRRNDSHRPETEKAVEGELEMSVASRLSKLESLIREA